LCLFMGVVSRPDRWTLRSDATGQPVEWPNE